MHTPPFAISARSSAIANSLPELLRLHVPRILVVEDDRDLEPLVRRAAATLSPPVAIDWCTSADEARALLELRYYDAVLADYVLEGAGSGLSLRTDVWKLQPQALFAMTSSYPLADYLHSVGRAGCPFMAKPFDVWTCRRFLRTLLVVEEGADS
jgi:DNA-binding response OmpR family regulator